jgi:hypothetical protein
MKARHFVRPMYTSVTVMQDLNPRWGEAVALTSAYFAAADSSKEHERMTLRRLAVCVCVCVCVCMAQCVYIWHNVCVVCVRVYTCFVAVGSVCICVCMYTYAYHGLLCGSG